MQAILFRLWMLVRRFGARFHRARQSRELSEEMAFHVEMLTRDGMARGLSENDARTTALRKFGNRTSLAEQAHEMSSLGSLETAARDARIGLRALRRSPAFALVAILTLALGIGLSTAVFTVADAVLLRPLPMRDQARVVALWGQDRKQGFDHYPLGLDDARAFARRSRSLEQVAFASYYGATAVPVRLGDQITRLHRALVSGGFFQMLGTRPVLGRALGDSDDVRGAAPVLVLSYAAWRQRFGGDPRVLGQQLRMYGSDLVYTVIGVMPQGLDYPRGTDFWAPLIPSTPLDRTSFIALDVIGRLRSGTTPADARGELTAFFARPEAPTPERALHGVAHTLPQLILGDIRPALLAFAAAAGLLLLITCINVANLLLVRGLARMREIAVRSALGAGRAQVVAQLLIENALLAIAGGVLGVAVAAGAVRCFVAFAPAGVPRLDEIHLNAAALAGAVAITGIAMLIFALAPAVMTSRVEPQQVLRSDTRQGASRRSRFATEGLVVGQMALALLVLSAAGLIARSLIKLERAKLSLDPSHLLIGELAIRSDEYGSTAKQTAMLDALLPQLRALPGVLGASPVVAAPFSGSGGWDGAPAAEGETAADRAANPVLNMEVVAPDYFATLGIPILRGRGFTEADREGAQAVVMLSESAARHYWPSDNPIGKRLTMGGGSRQMLTVVGIVPDTRYRNLREARPSIYFPLHQSFFPFAPTTLAIRTSGSAAALVPAIRRVIGETAPGVALVSARPFESYLDGPLAQPRLNALLLAIFAGAALALAAVGLFGVMATMVRQRTRELGVRMALGATATDLRRMVVRRGLVIAGLGVGAGLVGALLANRLLAGLLYDVSPTDGVTLAAVAAALLSVAGVASVIPACAITRIDPVSALRAE
ncbi:MAG TPA: ABC transporter permease [Gemmatimonadaceae bacterium]|nr:ABC transporter permease [Gemmatimonadaceae bacterium]